MSRQQQDTLEQEQREMEEFTEIGSIGKLSAAMAKAFPKIGAAVKGKENSFFSSKYADLSAVMDVIKPALIENGLWFTQLTHPHDKGIVVETMLLHESGEALSFGRLFFPAAKHDPQGFASALTYARRNSLKAAFGVPEEDDDGNAAAKATKHEQATPAPESLVDAAKNAAMEGTEDFRKYWAKLSKDAREQLRPHLTTLQKAAETADKVAA